MSGSDMLGQLQRYRALLMGVEAIGWLHMAGKAHPGFLQLQGGCLEGSYFPKKWHEQLTDAWDGKWHWVPRPDDFQWPDSFASFLKQFDEGPKAKAVGLLQAAHAMASDIEKNLPKNASAYLGQDCTHLWRTNAFGHPERNLLPDPPPVLAEGAWEYLLGRIEGLLDAMERLGQDPATGYQEWWDWRERAIGGEGWLRKAFQQTLAETRLPNNDVTLWDQSYVAAALFKSAAAGAVLAGKQGFQWDKDLKQQTGWRLLSVAIGAEHYEERAVRVGDWLGAREDLDGFFRDVRHLLEVGAPVGSQLYSDGTVAVFSFPGLKMDGEQGVTDPEAEDLRMVLAEEIDGIARSRGLETPPRCELSGSTRSLLPLAEEARKARAGVKVPLHRDWAVPFGGSAPALGGGGRHVCPVCGVRPGEEASSGSPVKDQPCGVCKTRRRHRLDRWLGNGYEGDTIWFSEVADGNDRLALISLNLDLAPWLGGRGIDSLRAQAAAEWVRHNPAVEQAGIDPSQPYESLVEYVQERLKAEPDPKDPVLKGLQEGYPFYKDWQSFYQKIVEDRAPDSEEAPAWADSSNEQRARWLVHQLLRKHPSPGRVHRFWRTAETFLEERLRAFRGIASRSSNRWRVRRLVVTAEEKGSDSPSWFRDREVYNGHWRGEPVGLLYRGSHGDFITVSNLARCLKDHEDAQALKGETLRVRGDDKDRTLDLTVTSVKDQAGGLGRYQPLVALDRGPERLRVLVPLEHAQACVNEAVGAWRKAFGRVWDRMPLHVGLVASPRMTPFQAVIEAARHLEDQPFAGGNNPERWRVISTEPRDGWQSLVLDAGGGERERELVTVPVRLPDGRPDLYYPNVRVEDRSLRNPRDFHHPADGTVYRNVADLQRGDGVWVHPARLAWLFMDSTGKRFEPVEPLRLSAWDRMLDLWRLVSRSAPSLAAVRDAWATLEEAWQQWKEEEGAASRWQALAQSVLGARWGVGGAALDELVAAAVSGELRVCLEWHLGVLKAPLKENFHEHQ